MKKILYILLGIVVVVGGIYFVLYYNTSMSITASPSGATISVDQKTISSGEKVSVKPGSHEVNIESDDYVPYRKLVDVNFGADKILNVDLRVSPIPEKIVTKQARFATLSLDNSSLYYLSDQTMYAAKDIDTENLSFEAISPDFFTDVTDVIWAPNQELAIIKQSANTSLYNFKRYDLLHQEITPFDDEGIKNTVWSSNSEYIMYYYEPGTGEKTLIKAAPTNSNKEIVYNFKNTDIKNPTIDWSPDMKDVSVVSNNKLYILNLYSNTMKVISGEERIIQARFTPTNKVLAVAETGVYLMDKDGQNKQKLDFYTDLSRITFLDNTRLIISEKIDIKYKFYLYNLIDNSKTELVYNQKLSINPIDNILSSNDKYLYFESNKYLYRMGVDDGQY